MSLSVVVQVLKDEQERVAYDQVSKNVLFVFIRRITMHDFLICHLGTTFFNLLTIVYVR